MYQVLRGIAIDDLESLVAALILSESEIDDLCDPFTERCVDYRRRGIGRASARIARAHHSPDMFA